MSVLPGMSARTERALRDAQRAFEECGLTHADDTEGGCVVADADGLQLALSHHAEGRLFGGTRALEAATAQPVLPRSRGLTARGRGAVSLRRVEFRARLGDAAGEQVASALNADPVVQEALRTVHFDSVRVDPDGTPVIRHLGGSVVWILVPPLLRSTPLVPEQARATAAALRALSRHGADAASTRAPVSTRDV